MDNMLRKALRRSSALRQQLENLLLGDDGDVWEAELKNFVAKRPCWVPHLIHPIDFDPASLLGAGWRWDEMDADPNALALSEVDFSNILLGTSIKEGESSITGFEKLRRLKLEGNIRLDPRFMLALFHEKGHKTLEHLHKERGITCLSFFGRIPVDPNGHRYVLGLYRDGVGWCWDKARLSHSWCDDVFSVDLVR